MVYNFLYILLAALGLGFLIFIHELGHYWMARRQGMTVEIFSIGFGKPFYSWMSKGVKWQLCWLPFGGYVRIAGMEKKGNLEPYQIPDGFYGKKPWARIQVAAIGPIVNLAFAFLAFCILWLTGGREKSFSEFTHLIGWVDPCSGLHQADVRAGDTIAELNGRPFRSFQDLLYVSLLEDTAPVLSGSKVDYFANEKSPFSYTFLIPPQLKGMDRSHAVIDTFSPASYLIYPSTQPLPEGSPMQNSGIQANDRLLWADGKVIFSRQELVATINEPRALLTIQRGMQTLLVRVPRVKVSDLRLNSVKKSEIEDWQHEEALKGKVQDLYFIPYTLSSHCVIEDPLTFLNANSQEESPCSCEERAEVLTPLFSGDRILAVDGIEVASATELLKGLQSRHIQIIVQNAKDGEPVLWTEADQHFIDAVDWKSLGAMICSIGTPDPIREMKGMRLLNPVEPKLIDDLPLSNAMRSRMESSVTAQKKAIESIKNPKEKEAALKQLEESQRKLLLGIPLQDRTVFYNPSPITLFGNIFKETYRTLVALVTGILSPKWLSGPVGMVQVMQHSWTVGAKEALYWLAVISMNLGILNFLPVPVLDGGHICFSLWELVTKKQIKAKTMERLIIPFILLLIAFFIYLTYHDIVRLIGKVF
jgi:regulator of sigma E protease